MNTGWKKTDDGELFYIITGLGRQIVGYGLVKSGDKIFWSDRFTKSLHEFKGVRDADMNETFEALEKYFTEELKVIEGSKIAPNLLYDFQTFVGFLDSKESLKKMFNDGIFVVRVLDKGFQNVLAGGKWIPKVKSEFAVEINKDSKHWDEFKEYVTNKISQKHGVEKESIEITGELNHYGFSPDDGGVWFKAYGKKEEKPETIYSDEEFSRIINQVENPSYSDLSYYFIDGTCYWVIGEVSNDQYIALDIVDGFNKVTIDIGKAKDIQRPSPKEISALIMGAILQEGYKPGQYIKCLADGKVKQIMLPDMFMEPEDLIAGKFYLHDFEGEKLLVMDLKADIMFSPLPPDDYSNKIIPLGSLMEVEGKKGSFLLSLCAKLNEKDHVINLINTKTGIPYWEPVIVESPNKVNVKDIKRLTKGNKFKSLAD